MSRKNEGTRRFEPTPDPPTRSIKPPAELVPDEEKYPFLRPPVQDDEIGRLGDYRVLRELGSGGMGIVFLAEDVALHRPVALKVMKPDLNKGGDAWQRFLREARAMAAIKHDNLVTVYQVGQDGDTIFLAMELLEGESLERWINRAGQLEPADIIRFGREIADGLATIHEHGLVHRDIKPANIWIEVRGERGTPRVKILDFGLARAVDDTSITRSGVVLGTPAFMSPEQARGQKADARSDLFSFGSVLYAMCTGREPFNADNTMAQLAALMVEKPAPIERFNRTVPEPLAELVMQMLAKNPDERPASSAEVGERLRKIKRLMTGKRRKPAGSATQELRKSDVLEVAGPSFFRRHGGWLLVLGAVAMVVTVGVIAFLVFFPPPHPDRDLRVDRGKVFAPADGTFLSDMRSLDRYNWPWAPLRGKEDPRFEKKGKGPPKAIDFISVQGKPAPHGLFMHPEIPDVPVGLRYQLDSRYRDFRAQVALNDSSHGSEAPLIFSVHGDGKELWRSRPIAQPGQMDTCEISVKGVNELKLQVDAQGPMPHGAHGVWIEPQVLR